MENGLILVKKRSRKENNELIFVELDAIEADPTSLLIEQTGKHKDDCLSVSAKAHQRCNYWYLTVSDEQHNHEPSIDLCGHPMACRMSAETPSTVVT